jgi:hypothetical protein
MRCRLPCCQRLDSSCNHQIDTRDVSLRAGIPFFFGAEHIRQLEGCDNLMEVHTVPRCGLRNRELKAAARALIAQRNSASGVVVSSRCTALMVAMRRPICVG